MAGNLDPRFRQMLVDQGFSLARPNAKTRARSLYSKLGKVLALTGVLIQLLSHHVRAASDSFDISTAKQGHSGCRGSLDKSLYFTSTELVNAFSRPGGMIYA